MKYTRFLSKVNSSRTWYSYEVTACVVVCIWYCVEKHTQSVITTWIEFMKMGMLWREKKTSTNNRFRFQFLLWPKSDTIQTMCKTCFAAAFKRWWRRKKPKKNKFVNIISSTNKYKCYERINLIEPNWIWNWDRKRQTQRERERAIEALWWQQKCKINSAIADMNKTKRILFIQS